MKGIPAELHHETLNKVIQKMPAPDNLIFTGMFPSQQYESDRIRWILEYGTAGMTPFVAPGAPAPTLGDDGMYAEGAASAAYWKEKTFLDEQILNNLREPLTPEQRRTAQRQVARQQRRLRTRCARRREWMLAKAFFDHGITYQTEKGTNFTVSYGVPSHHSQSLTGNDVWWDSTTGAPGSTATPVQDIWDVKKDFADDVGVPITDTFMNSTALSYLMFNSDLQTLLQKSSFGEGDLFSNPGPVLNRLLGFGNLTVYDDLFEVGAWLTSDASATNTVTVDDVTDFEAGETCRLYDLSTPFNYEELTISSVSIANSQITFTDNFTGSYKSNKDRVVMRKKFITDAKIGFMARSIDGEQIAEFMEAPFGLQRTYGMYADSKEEWDPDGIWMRIQNKGLPVVYHPDALYTLTIK